MTWYQLSAVQSKKGSAKENEGAINNDELIMFNPRPISPLRSQQTFHLFA